jgi:hypothetical protein
MNSVLAECSATGLALLGKKKQNRLHTETRTSSYKEIRLIMVVKKDMHICPDIRNNTIMRTTKV